MTTFNAQIPRDVAARYGRAAVQIAEEGCYVAPSGSVVEIHSAVQSAVRGTISYPGGSREFNGTTGEHATAIEVTNETTLSAGQRLLQDGLRAVVLNFASAVQPGGGFLTGARAQEEYLARSSGLFACLRDNPMYEFHRETYDPFYSDFTIYSPGVPVFRADGGELLESPYTISVITSAACLAKDIAAERQREIGPAMRQRIRKVLAIGLEHGHNAIVLGAWGCGAFGNDGHEIAGLFHQALEEDFRGAYQRVIFAIVDWSPERRFIRPFEAAFGGWKG